MGNCPNVTKMNLKVGYTLVGNMRFTEFSPWPETHFKPLSSSRRGKLTVCGLDHSGSQPFIYEVSCDSANIASPIFVKAYQ